MSPYFYSQCKLSPAKYAIRKTVPHPLQNQHHHQMIVMSSEYCELHATGLLLSVWSDLLEEMDAINQQNIVIQKE